MKYTTQECFLKMAVFYTSDDGKINQNEEIILGSYKRIGGKYLLWKRETEKENQLNCHF